MKVLNWKCGRSMAFCCFSLMLVSSAAGNMPNSGLDVLPGQLVSAPGDTAEDFNYITPRHLRFPFVSTYHVRPTVLAGEDVKIGFFVTDWDHSLKRLKDGSKRFDVTVRISREGGESHEQVFRDIPTGDGECVFKDVAVGEWNVSVTGFDRRARLPSHTAWQMFRVVRPESLVIPESQVYRMSKADLKTYCIRNDGDYERVVVVENVEKHLATHPHKDGSRPGYTVYAPGTRGIANVSAWKDARLVYDANYDRSLVAKQSVATAFGLQRLIDDKAALGYRKIVFLPGCYRVSHVKTIQVPNRTTIDLNGATVKLNGFTGNCSSVFAISAKTDAAIENGTIEGDYWEHDYANSKNKAEWVHGVSLNSCCRYCEIRNVTCRYIVGYGGENKTTSDGPGEWLLFAPEKGSGFNWVDTKRSKWEPGGLRLSDGTVEASAKGQFTTDYLSVEGLKKWKWLEISEWHADRSFRSWCVPIAFYDAKKKFVSSQIGYRLRAMPIPDEAAFARISVEGETLEHILYKSNALKLCHFKYPVNCTVKNCRFERCRCVGWAMSQCRNILFEGNEFVLSGENLARCAFDSEDGGEMAMDVTFRNNDFHDNPYNDFLVMFGMNFTLENNRMGVYLYPRCNSWSVKSNDCKYIGFCCRERNRTGYWRYSDNICREEFMIGGAGYKHSNWEIYADDVVYDGNIIGTNFVVKSGAAGIYRNCRFSNVKCSVGSAEDCTFENTRYWHSRYNHGTWKNCTATNGCVGLWDAKVMFVNCTFKDFKVDPDSAVYLGCRDEIGVIPREGRKPTKAAGK